MPDPIPCPECGHSIDGHGESLTCLDCWHEVVAAVDACRMRPSDIARAYAKKCFHEGWDACELQWAVRHSE